MLGHFAGKCKELRSTNLASKLHKDESEEMVEYKTGGLSAIFCSPSVCSEKES